MNKYFDQSTEKIYYKTKHYPTVTYAKLDSGDQEYMRYMYSMLYGHIATHKDTSEHQSQLYNWFFTELNRTLPRPSKHSGIGTYNTWATFLAGLEHNFELTGTQDFSLKQLKHIETIVNHAVDYFSSAHKDFEPTVEAPHIKLIKC